MTGRLSQWPLRGELWVFYSGGFGNSTEDLRRLLRHIARWSQRRPDLDIEGVQIQPLFLDDPADPVTWGGTVLVGTGDDGTVRQP